MTPEEKALIFEKELGLILDHIIREFTRLCVISAPEYFFTDCPASSTGKFHPLNELAGNGTVVHTKKVVTLAYELVKGLDCEAARNEVIAACIIHDLRKQGLDKTGHTVPSHPELAAQLVDEVQRDTQMLSDKSYEMIRSCVGYHYGLWSIEQWKKPLSEYTSEEYTVYLSDFVASKRMIDVNYKR